MNHRQRLAASTLCALIAVAVGGGCAHLENWRHNGFKVGPDYCQPVASVSHEWIDFNDRRVISQGVDEVAWWRHFHDPNIDQLVEAVYRQNLPLREAALRVLEARAQRAVAVGTLFPQAQQAYAAYNRIQFGRSGNAAGVEQDALVARAFDLWNIGFNLGWEIDLWGKIRRAVESADANLDAQIENYDDVLVTLIADTVATYVEVRTLEQRLEYAESNVDIQKTFLKLAEARQRNGAVSELDVTTARSRVEETEALIPELQTLHRQATNRLCVLLGIPPQELPQLGSGPIPSSPSEIVAGIPAQLLRRRPDVRQAEREVAGQSALIGVAVADLYPEFSIAGNISSRSSSFSSLWGPASNAGFLTPQFNWNILNYGRIKNNIRVEDARFRQLAVRYQQTVLEANREVEDAIVEFLKAQLRRSLLAASVKDTERSVELAQIQYREGSIGFNRVNNQLRDLVPRQENLALARADVALGMIRVYKALGGGWQIRLGCGAGSGHVTPPTSPPAADVPAGSTALFGAPPPPLPMAALSTNQ